MSDETPDLTHDEQPFPLPQPSFSFLVLSLRAGVMEEIVFRWLIFMWSIAAVRVLDWILGGFVFSHGLVWFLNEYITLPIADFVTFRLLHSLLTDPSAWFVAVGLIVANARFRDGHKYQGWFGMVNSWFIGMYFFYLMLTYGLLASITVHFLYDALIFTIRYVDRVIERARGVSNGEDGDSDSGN